MRIATLLLLLAIPLTSCGGGVEHGGEVDYLKDTVIYQEGDGVYVYVILADARGRMTTAGGRIRLAITDRNDTELYSSIRSVKENDFIETTRGRGSFEQDVLLYTFGRIRFDSFLRTPDGLLNASVKFDTHDGRILKGEGSTHV